MGSQPRLLPSPGVSPGADPPCLRPQGASALFDMIEYYESATHLNISFNKHIGTRGWQAAAHMMRKVGAPPHPAASPRWGGSGTEGPGAFWGQPALQGCQAHSPTGPQARPPPSRFPQL